MTHKKAKELGFKISDSTAFVNTWTIRYGGVRRWFILVRSLNEKTDFPTRALARKALRAKRTGTNHELWFADRQEKQMEAMTNANIFITNGQEPAFSAIKKALKRKISKEIYNININSEKIEEYCRYLFSLENMEKYLTKK